jgi:Zn finger protein HypA/HybF involved in hydrogenase expression
VKKGGEGQQCSSAVGLAGRQHLQGSRICSHRKKGKGRYRQVYVCLEGSARVCGGEGWREGTSFSHWVQTGGTNSPHAIAHPGANLSAPGLSTGLYAAAPSPCGLLAVYRHCEQPSRHPTEHMGWAWQRVSAVIVVMGPLITLKKAHDHLCIQHTLSRSTHAKWHLCLESQPLCVSCSDSWQVLTQDHYTTEHPHCFQG